MNNAKGRPANKGKGETREEYLGIIKDLFIRDGYAGTTIREIGKVSGYNPSNFYAHWKDKDDVFNEITGCVADMDISAACQYPIEYAMMVEKMLSENGNLIKKLSELSPELLVSML